jgi:hypothetical protein
MYRWRRVSRFGTRALLRLPRIDRGLGHYGFMYVGPIHWAARGAEGVVIALDFSSTRWATFFALSLFYFLLQVRLRRFRPLFTGAFLDCALGTCGRAFSYSLQSVPSCRALLPSARECWHFIYLYLAGGQRLPWECGIPEQGPPWLSALTS